MFYDLEQSGIPFEPDDDHVWFDYDDGEFSFREYKREPQRPVEPTPRVRQGGSKAAVLVIGALYLLSKLYMASAQDSDYRLALQPLLENEATTGNAPAFWIGMTVTLLLLLLSKHMLGAMNPYGHEGPSGREHMTDHDVTVRKWLWCCKRQRNPATQPEPEPGLDRTDTEFLHTARKEYRDQCDTRTRTAGEARRQRALESIERSLMEWEDHINAAEEDQKKIEVLGWSDIKCHGDRPGRQKGLLNKQQLDKWKKSAPEPPEVDNDRTFRCTQCQKAFMAMPWAEPEGRCGGCNLIMCPECREVKSQGLADDAPGHCHCPKCAAKCGAEERPIMWGRLLCCICKMAVCTDCMSLEEVSGRARCDFCRTAQRFISKTLYNRSPDRDEDKPPPTPDKSRQQRQKEATPKGSVAKVAGWQAGNKSRKRTGKRRMLMLGVVCLLVAVSQANTLPDPTTEDATVAGGTAERHPSAGELTKGRIKASRPRKIEPVAGEGDHITQLFAVHQKTSKERRMKQSDADEEGKRVRDLKKGWKAWELLKQQGEALMLDADLLLVHAVGDKTALTMYAPNVRKFLAFAEQHSCPMSTYEQIDDAMCKYLVWSCYVEDRHPQQGSYAVNGFVWLFPESGRHLPRAWKTLQSWEKLTITTEGEGVPKETAACMSDWLRAQSSPEARLVGDFVDVAIDGYCRQQDLIGNLQRCDVVFDTKGNDTKTSLQFGRSSRGESSKTGRNQGVILDEAHSTRVMQRLCEGKSPKDKIFPVSTETVRKWWNIACKEVAGEHHSIGPVHSCRHTGPSFDMIHGFRNLDEVMKRGRWKTINSVHRYAKSHTYLAAVAKQSDAVRARGEAILEARGSKIRK